MPTCIFTHIQFCIAYSHKLYKNVYSLYTYTDTVAEHDLILNIEPWHWI